MIKTIYGGTVPTQGHNRRNEGGVLKDGRNVAKLQVQGEVMSNKGDVDI